MSCKPLVNASSGEICTGAVVVIVVSGAVVSVVFGVVSLFLLLHAVARTAAMERIKNMYGILLILEYFIVEKGEIMVK